MNTLIKATELNNCKIKSVSIKGNLIYNGVKIECNYFKKFTLYELKSFFLNNVLSGFYFLESVLDNGVVITVTDTVCSFEEVVNTDLDSLAEFGHLASFNKKYQNPLTMVLHYNDKLETIYLKKYFSKLQKKISIPTESSLKFCLKELWINFNNYLGNVHNVVIPLSAGLDSMILYKSFYDTFNFYPKSFCYGVKGDFDFEALKYLAKKNNLPIRFVDYNKINAEIKINDIKNIFHLNNYNSIPHLQDYLVVKFLIEDGFIKKNDFIVPGHSGDIFSGNHYEKCFKRYLSHKRLFNLGSKSEFFIQKDKRSTSEVWSWYYRQRFFILGSLNVYKYFGLNYYAPLWDESFVNLFASLSECYISNQNNIFFNKSAYSKICSKYLRNLCLGSNAKVFYKLKSRLYNKVFNNSNYYKVICSKIESTNVTYSRGVLYNGSRLNKEVVKLLGLL